MPQTTPPLARHVSTTALLMVLLLGGAAPAAAEPFTPQDDTDVVEQLPRRLDTPTQRQARREARAQLRRDPAQLPLALGLARQAIEQARLQGDPRLLGEAQAALAPWWDMPEPPAPVRLLRATVRQSAHEFDAALRDLDGLLATRQTPPSVQAQAELTRSSVLQVLGRWAQAQAGCERLQGESFSRLGDGVGRAAAICLAELRGLQGQADAAAQALQALAAHTPQDESAWLALVQAELAERRGDPAAAQSFYRAATQGQPTVYALAAHADWLLDQGRAAEAARLLQGRDETDALLLRLAIAWKRTSDTRAAPAEAALHARWLEASQRGDTSHARERARFELDVRQQEPAVALREAQANWAVQKEPADAILLVRAAQAAGQPAAAQPVWAFQQTTGLQDARLARLRGQEVRP